MNAKRLFLLAVTAIVAGSIRPSSTLAGDVILDNLTVGGPTVVWSNLIMHKDLILTNYSTATIPTNGLKLYNNFDVDSGGVVHDSSGNGLDGYTVGNVTYETGHSGMAARFTDYSTYIVNSNAALNADGWSGLSISIWVYRYASTTYNTVFDRGGLTDNTWGGLCMQLSGNTYSDTSGYLMTNKPSQASAVVSTPGPVPNGQWIHFAMVCGTNRMRLYVNGALGSETNYSIPSLCDVANTKFVLGTVGRQPYINWGDMYFDGKVDELRVYDRALTEDEVSVLFHYAEIGQPPPERTVWGRNMEADGRKLDGLFGVAGLTNAMPVFAGAPAHDQHIVSLGFVDNVLTGKAEVVHTHDASSFVSGSLALPRIPDSMPGKNVDRLLGVTASEYVRLDATNILIRGQRFVGGIRGLPPGGNVGTGNY